MKKALGNSFNNASVRLAKSLGLTDVYNFYKTYGFKFDFPAEYYGYSLVLGNPSITLWDLVLSYTQLVPRPNKEGDVDPMSFLLYDMLRDPDNRDVSFGTNSILNTSILQAVKTGTSSNFRDNTIISYSPDMVIGLWV
jgi:membrane carboxypeptidase/penicillin-binding protein PbpC